MHSSAANSAIENIANRLTADGDFDKGISVRLLLKNWSAAFSEWPIKAIRDALYASPQFPRIIDGTAAIQDTIAKAVSACEVAYVGKTSDGRYSPFIYDTGMLSKDVEISEYERKRQRHTLRNALRSLTSRGKASRRKPAISTHSIQPQRSPHNRSYRKACPASFGAAKCRRRNG